MAGSSNSVTSSITYIAATTTAVIGAVIAGSSQVTDPTRKITGTVWSGGRGRRIIPTTGLARGRTGGIRILGSRDPIRRAGRSKTGKRETKLVSTGKRGRGRGGGIIFD